MNVPAVVESRTDAPARGSTVAAFVRFVLCGGGTGLLASGALVLLGRWLPLALANAVVTVVSTLLATELHGRFTFREGRPGLREHLQSAGTAAAAYLGTTGALLALHDFAPGAGAPLQQAVYLAANSLTGVARFAALRALVFTRAAAERRRARAALSRQTVTTAA